MSGQDEQIVGVDVGGANLKYATAAGQAFTRPFAMWKHWQRLSQTLSADLQRFRCQGSLAVTMTGELADCFVDRGSGVRHIIHHVSQAASQVGREDVRFYGIDGRFHTADDAAEQVDLIAAANWHALSELVAAEFVSDGLLIDIGSTTTDIIPIQDGCVATEATTDYERLLQGSLVYVGCRRTPVCALVDSLCFRGCQTPVMNEVFATIDDARIVCDIELEDPSDTDSADGGPRTRERAANRLARMIGLDRRSVSVAEAVGLGKQIIEAARGRISFAVDQFAAPVATVVISGHGGGLIEFSRFAEVVLLSERINPGIARCAPAYAVARLYQRQRLSV